MSNDSMSSITLNATPTGIDFTTVIASRDGRNA